MLYQWVDISNQFHLQILVDHIETNYVF